MRIIAPWPRRRSCRLATLLSMLGMLAGPASTSPGQPADDPPADDGLESVPLTVETLGLSWHPPAGAAVRSDRVGDRLTIVVEDPAIPRAWSIRAMHMTSTLPEPTAAGQIEDHLRRLADSAEHFEVIANDPLPTRDAVGQLCYLRHIGSDGRAVVRGWLVLPCGGRAFIIFTIVTLPEHLPALQELLDRSFRTISLNSLAEVGDARLGRLERGRAFLDALTPQRLRALCGHTQWSRIYRPGVHRSGGADEEIGYSHVEVSAGKRGLLNPEKAESTYSPGELEEGLVVRIRGRLVGDRDRGIYFDSDAIYWLAWDQSEEAWSVRGTQRQGDAARSESETGLRRPPSTGSPIPRLSVIRSRTTTNEREPFEWSVPDVYLSQALGWAVERLLPRDASAAPVEMSYYAYTGRGDEPRLTLRTDHWAPATDTAGEWVLTTRIGAEGESFQSIYGADGSMRRVTMRDGSLSEPMDLAELRQIWSRRGLRLDRPR